MNFSKVSVELVSHPLAQEHEVLTSEPSTHRKAGSGSMPLWLRLWGSEGGGGRSTELAGQCASLD